MIDSGQSGVWFLCFVFLSCLVLGQVGLAILKVYS